MQHADVARRLDFLMRLTNTRNVQLARALNFDASYISRIRSGKRNLPAEEPFCEPAAHFFAHAAREPYQLDALAREVLGGEAWPTDEDEATRLIMSWLLGSDARRSDPGASAASESGAADTNGDVRLFFGIDGRRSAALELLDRARAAGPGLDLVLQSDEDASWMLEDATFLDQWSMRMAELAEADCTFTVIHTLSRDAFEMWAGVRAWLPLYLTGAIKPFYYPRLRDGVRRRSLFVVKGVCALTANSVSWSSAEALSALVSDQRAVEALTGEATAYLALCCPLMRRFSGAEAMAELLEDFDEATGEVRATVTAGALLATREGVGAIVCAASGPSCAYLISEPRLVCAIGDSMPKGAVHGDEGVALVRRALGASLDVRA